MGRAKYGVLLNPNREKNRTRHDGARFLCSFHNAGNRGVQHTVIIRTQFNADSFLAQYFRLFFCFFYHFWFSLNVFYKKIIRQKLLPRVAFSDEPVWNFLPFVQFSTFYYTKLVGFCAIQILTFFTISFLCLAPKIRLYILYNIRLVL